MITDRMGREIRDWPNGESLIIERFPDFEQWIETRFGSYSEFLSLKQHEKKKLFLRYKWGFLDNKINEDLESTRKYIIFAVKGREFKDETERYYWIKVKEREAYYEELSQMLCLNERKDDPLLKMAKEVLQ